jgi:hypothetical protein
LHPAWILLGGYFLIKILNLNNQIFLINIINQIRFVKVFLALGRNSPRGALGSLSLPSRSGGLQCGDETGTGEGWFDVDEGKNTSGIEQKVLDELVKKGWPKANSSARSTGK